MRGIAVIVASAISLLATPAFANQFLAFFDYGQATLQLEAKYMAARVVRYGTEYRGEHQPWFSVYAHLDGAEEADFGTDLDVRRAQAVASEIAAQGADPARIRMFVCGASNLARPRPPGTAERLDRRAQVEIHFGGPAPVSSHCRAV